MTTTADPGTPIFDALVRLLKAGELSSRPDTHAQPVPSACTPVSWFGPMPDPVHARHSATTVVIPAVVDEQERKAS